MDFLILRPLPPKTGYHFFEGGGGVVGGGVKSFRSEGSKQWETPSCHIRLWSNRNALGRRILGLRFDSRSMGAGAGAVLAALGFEPPTKKSAAVCITIRPLPFTGPVVLPTGCGCVCH